MAIILSGQKSAFTDLKNGHAKARPLLISLDQPGRIRVGNWLALLNIGHSTFYAKRRLGEIPQPDGLDKRPYWNTDTVRDFLSRK